MLRRLFDVLWPLSWILAWLCLFSSIAAAQTASYRGRTYTPQSFPRATWCSCGMCQQIRAQWQRSTAKVEPTAYEQVGTQNAELVQVARQVTHYRTVKRCVNGVCQLVREPYTTTELVWLPAPKRDTKQIVDKPQVANKFVSTPQPVVSAMISALDIQPGETFVDPGCGDGRLVIEAARQGAVAVGIEIDASTAKQARQAVIASGVSAWIEQGDSLARNSIAADCVGVYLYPDQLSELVTKLQPGTRIASYAHEIPGLPNQRHTVAGESFYTAIVPSETPVAVRSKASTFGMAVSTIPTYGL